MKSLDGEGRPGQRDDAPARPGVEAALCPPQVALEPIWTQAAPLPLALWGRGKGEGEPPRKAAGLWANGKTR